MARTVIRSKPKKKRVRIYFRQRAEMHKKGSKKPVVRDSVPVQMPRDNGASFKIKIRHK